MAIKTVRVDGRMINVPVDDTIIRGTMITEDLIEAFEGLLQTMDPKGYKRYMQSHRGWKKDDPDGYLNESLWNKMNEYAPEGYYFGAHPGDGSDYAYWYDVENTEWEQPEPEANEW